MSEIPEIGIVDTRNLVKIIQNTYGYDFSEFALTSFKRRIELFLHNNNIRNFDSFLNKLSQEKVFAESFITDIQITTTELFRDPSLWRWLRDEFFPKNITSSNYKIWLPDVVDGDELYTLLIVLEECQRLDNVKIIASSMSEKCLDLAKNGIINQKKFETSLENYKRFHGNKLFSDYLISRENIFEKTRPLLDRVEYKKINILSEKGPDFINFILFRNKLIYFNPTLQNKVLSHLYENLNVGGILCVGIKEDISSFTKENFIEINASENVFKKK